MRYKPYEVDAIATEYHSLKECCVKLLRSHRKCEVHKRHKTAVKCTETVQCLKYPPHCGKCSH